MVSGTEAPPHLLWPAPTLTWLSPACPPFLFPPDLPFSPVISPTLSPRPPAFPQGLRPGLGACGLHQALADLCPQPLRLLPVLLCLPFSPFPLAPAFVLLDIAFLDSQIFSCFFLSHPRPVIPWRSLPLTPVPQIYRFPYPFFSCPPHLTFLPLFSLSVLLSHDTTGLFLIFLSAAQCSLWSTCHVPGSARGPLTGSRPPGEKGNEGAVGRNVERGVIARVPGATPRAGPKPRRPEGRGEVARRRLGFSWEGRKLLSQLTSLVYSSHSGRQSTCRHPHPVHQIHHPPG